MRARDRIVRNFVSRYGVERLERLIALLSAGDSGQRIAEEFEVSRERVRQWKDTFGTVVTMYQVHADVQRMMAVMRVADPSSSPINEEELPLLRL